MSGTLERSVLLVTCGIGAFHAESDCELISVKFMTATPLAPASIPRTAERAMASSEWPIASGRNGFDADSMPITHAPRCSHA